MKWWQKAAIATFVLLVLDGCLALVIFHRIHNTSSNVRVESFRHEKLGHSCGQILGVGMIAVWFLAYFNEKKRRTV